ncbi:glycosyl hydrolase family 28-related protein [Poseidonocella sedimentorum]|uniref:Pectate lyase superfamily protein n=1 Tax=Poseidonocella sedimentorum TaxID=871652 RepID=A0A1I6E600_9RHOB|nr:glycosyl hydrolase family 28-related protein [Poseidonocella sedimentorum]SFR12981.1 Pectate lyase superfamily protein [Poseidonocella sedimentorum]
MNIAITDGALLMPPAFSEGLDVWARGDGTPGSDSYEGRAEAALVSNDGDFGTCLELTKTQSTQKLRYMGQTPIYPGVYLRVRARVKAFAGNLPSVRIAGWAGDANGAAVNGITTFGDEVSLDTHGEVVEVSAVVGVGSRSGVSMAWGAVPVYGHFGLDLVGASGGTVRIDDIVIEDVTSAFLGDTVALVDVRDHGAVGDGVTDDSAAFEAADAAADGRTVVVGEGTYHLAGSVTFESEVEFRGTVTMPRDAILTLKQNFDLPSYIDAFGDDVEAFKRAFQSLLNNSGHESLDLCGRRVALDAPLDMQAAVPNRTTYATRRVIRNGQFDASESAGWDTEVTTSAGTYNPSNPYTLTNVANAANIAVGALVEGAGVGREVYVQAVNVGTQSVTLSVPLYDAEGTQSFTFRRFKYLLDFSGFNSLSKMVLEDIEFRCSGHASAVMIAPAGLIFHVKDSFFTFPKDRGITSIGNGCQGMLVDRCQFLSNESPELVQNRTSIALNSNANDIKLRNNRIMHFRHAAIIAGRGSIISGNHWFGGDEANDGVRLGGLIFTQTNPKTTVTGNYIDNYSIEWGNEHDPAPEHSNEYSFGGLSIIGNIFTSMDAAPWFRFIVIRPHGAGHFLNSLSVTGNVFRTVSGNIDRVEMVDTSFAELDFSRSFNVVFDNNTFNGVDVQTRNPLIVEHEEATAASTWSIDGAPYLPFGGRARTVVSAMPEGPLTNDSGGVRFVAPYADVEQGPNGDQVHLVWPEPVRGTVQLTMRMDRPI